MSKSTVLLLALAGGLLIGAAARYWHAPALLALAAVAKPVGALWLAALKMTLVPLIFAMVADGVGSFAASREGGRTAGLLLGAFVALLVLGAVFGMAATAALLRIWPVPAGVLASLMSAPAATQAPPGFMEQLLAFIPDNPVAAAAKGQMAPLVVFAVLFGVAAAGIPQPQRASLGLVLKAVGETMMRIVHGVLWFAPLGVFTLGLGVALDAGLSGAALLGQGVLFSVLASMGAIALVYLLVTLGGVGLRRFALAAAGPQAVAAGTCSSMATLPAMIDAAETRLGMAPALAGSVLPLAVSTFRFGTAVSTAMACTFACAAAGVHPSLAQWAAAVGLIVLTNIGVAGLPAAAVLYAAEAPILQLLGAPLGFIPLWIAVFAIPDIFVTVSNVTTDLSIAALVQRLQGRQLGAA